MESVSSSRSSSCWCCADCIQSTLDRRHSANASAAAAGIADDADGDDDDGRRSVYNGLIQTDEQSATDVGLPATTGAGHLLPAASATCQHVRPVGLTSRLSCFFPEAQCWCVTVIVKFCLNPKL